MIIKHELHMLFAESALELGHLFIYLFIWQHFDEFLSRYFNLKPVLSLPGGRDVILKCSRFAAAILFPGLEKQNLILWQERMLFFLNLVIHDGKVQKIGYQMKTLQRLYFIP